MKESIKTGVILALVIISMLLGVFIVYQLRGLLLLVLIAIVLTTGVDPVVQKLQQTMGRWFKLPRVSAILIVLLFSVTVILGAFSILIVTATKEGISFARETWPGMRDTVLNWAALMSSRYDFIPAPDAIYRKLGEQSGEIAGYFWSTTQTVMGFIGSLFSLMTVLILTFFFTYNKDGIVKVFSLFIPPRYRDRIVAVTHMAASKMGGWLRGMVILALLMSVIVTIGMTMLGVKYPVLLGIVAGLGELVPMLGPHLAAIPAVLILLISGAPIWKIVAVLIFFAVLAQVENYFFMPKVMERQVELPPITAILALLTGGTLLGLVGAVLAVPLAAAGRVVLHEAVFPAIQGQSAGEQPAEQTAPSPAETGDGEETDATEPATPTAVG